ncbi:hypothetical protein GS539_04020 [Rhodococcus hoagii]|nr:hypothetical protein [Prescottella equi]
MIVVGHPPCGQIRTRIERCEATVEPAVESAIFGGVVRPQGGQVLVTHADGSELLVVEAGDGGEDAGVGRRRAADDPHQCRNEDGADRVDDPGRESSAGKPFLLVQRFDRLDDP